MALIIQSNKTCMCDTMMITAVSPERSPNLLSWLTSAAPGPVARSSSCLASSSNSEGHAVQGYSSMQERRGTCPLWHRKISILTEILLSDSGNPLSQVLAVGWGFLLFIKLQNCGKLGQQLKLVVDTVCFLYFLCLPGFCRAFAP